VSVRRTSIGPSYNFGSCQSLSTKSAVYGGIRTLVCRVHPCSSGILNNEILNLTGSKTFDQWLWHVVDVLEPLRLTTCHTNFSTYAGRRRASNRSCR
jgi:hypothetical protein